jgi:outer membrane protein TolC
MATLVAAVVGCHPQEPFYLKNVDNDLKYWKGEATQIDYPDVTADRLPDVANAVAPFSLKNQDPKNFWEITLEQAIEYSLKNAKVMKNIGGQVSGPADFITRSLESVPTIYDPALVESNPRTGTEAALSAFDAQLQTALTWESTDAPQNVSPLLASITPNVSEHQLGTFQAQLQKTVATGGIFSLTHSVNYDDDRGPNTSSRLLYSSDWNVKLVAQMRQPLLQGAGTQFNRIAGPGATPGVLNGVMLARINTDIALASFEENVRNLVSDVEIAYWELYFDYQRFGTARKGRDDALEMWRKTYNLFTHGARRGSAAAEASTRNQYYIYRNAAEQALNDLYATEAKLRYLMGLAPTDGRLIRPKDEATTAKVAFDWCDVLAEGLVRSPELRQQKWVIKNRELSLIAEKNFLLPRLDLVGQYRWLGMGNRLDGANPLNLGAITSSTTDVPDSNAYRTLMDGQYQEWQIGVQGQINLGFRKEMAAVRNAQLDLTKEQVKLQEAELELAHQLSFVVRDLETDFVLMQTAFNRRKAAEDQLNADLAIYESGVGETEEGTPILNDLLRAQQEFSQAESDYYRAVVNYNRAIAAVHYRKGSLLEYNGVYLAEGPWPGKAYFDARRRSRARAASTYLDYGFTQPKVISRGPIEQKAGGEGCQSAEVFKGGELFKSTGEGQKQGEPTAAPPKPETISLPSAAFPAEPPSPGPMAEPKPEPMIAPEPATKPSAATRGGSTTTAPTERGERTTLAPTGRIDSTKVRPAGNVAPLDDAAPADKVAPADSAAPAAKPEDRNSQSGWRAPAKQSAVARAVDRLVLPAGWNAVEQGGSHEPGQNPSPTATDRSASGWTGVQR